MINEKLLNLLCCPKCKTEINERKMFLLCNDCNKAYPVLGNIPDMLIEDAWSIEKAKKDKYMHSIKI